MKNFTLLIALAALSNTANAQDNNLFTTPKWYLQEVKTSAKTYTVDQQKIASVAIFNKNSSFHASLCKNVNGELDFQNTTTFNFRVMFNLVNNGLCGSDAELLAIDQEYTTNFFEKNMWNKFSYSISTVGSDKVLKLTSKDGNVATYSSKQVLATEDIDLTAQINIYPNPVSSTLSIQTKETILGITIFNVNGQLVYKGKENSIHVGSLPKGNYYIQIETTKGTLSKSFIKK